MTSEKEDRKEQLLFGPVPYQLMNNKVYEGKIWINASEEYKDLSTYDAMIPSQ